MGLDRAFPDLYRVLHEVRKTAVGREPDIRDPDHRVHAERRPRAKKNRKRWCKGKVGVAHVPHIMLPSFRVSYKHSCRSRPTYSYSARAYRKSTTTWWCWHEERCFTCGKVLRSFLNETECPDRPVVTT